SRGLSRLLSSLLKRRSQCGSDAGDQQDQEQTKAPIADPEPELRAEGELAQDQRSVSSAEAQVHQQNVHTHPLHSETEVLVLRSHRTPSVCAGPGARAPRQPKSLQIRVTLLDNSVYECELDKHCKGLELFMKVCDHLNLLEKDYYGLAVWESPVRKTWMDLTKEIRRQVQGAVLNLTFNVKFYPPDPAQLSEDITRYYLCLQLRQDILQGHLPCSFVTLALLGSYALQSELGEYDPDLHGADYAKDMKMVPGQTKELEDKMMELHQTYRSMSPAQADLMFLENAKKLSMYGVDLHPAKDLDGVDIMLGVCSSGLMVYKEKLRINRFPWPKVLKVSYKRSSFFIKIRPSEAELYESAIGFKLPTYKAAKKLWKVCVEHHAFFRLTATEATHTPRKFLALGSKFRYSGRTQAQSRQASSLIDRPAPLFQRSSSKRNTHSLDGGPPPAPRTPRPFSAPVMSPLSPGEPSPSPVPSDPRGPAPREQRCADRKAEGPESTRGHDLQPQPTPETKDLEKTQTQTLRHHNSISELKRSFMESLPEARPSEWDKRLSGSSPFRTVSTVSAGEQSPVLKTQTITISDVTEALRGVVVYRDAPLGHSETKTGSYESAQPDECPVEKDAGALLSAQTITSETVSTTTTTQITKTVKGGISETRIEKRIVITGDTEIDHDKALAQAIKEAKEQHPDMSVTRVVVHQETEITPE
uniref:Protein 4.1 n=1 Tax=Tetraodon nigroviridis TaxID=99883 RepID=H3CBX6_TETNG